MGGDAAGAADRGTCVFFIAVVFQKFAPGNTGEYHLIRPLLTELPCHIQQLLFGKLFVIWSIGQDTGLCQIWGQNVRIANQRFHALTHLLRISGIGLAVIPHHRVDDHGGAGGGKVLQELLNQLNLFERA